MTGPSDMIRVYKGTGDYSAKISLFYFDFNQLQVRCRCADIPQKC